MKRANWIPVLLVLAAITTAAAAAPDHDATLGRYVGVWSMDLVAHEESFGDLGGKGAGTMTCRWGLSRAWVDCEMDSMYDAMGHYVLKITLYRTARADTVGAFVTNSFGGGRLYHGTWEAANTLQFKDAWVDPKNKWEHQLIRYAFDGDDRIDFSIDVSKDQVRWLPHSSGRYTRQR